jgi:hypothetical protein
MRDWLLLTAAIAIGGLLSGGVLLTWFYAGVCW